MMCSTWKISVFGIVALMLAFGLTAGDAFAHSDGQHAGHTRTTVKHYSAAAITVTATSQAGEDGTGGAVTRDAENLFADSTEAANMLRATEKLDALVFTYSHGGPPSKKGTVTLTIPRTWTRAQPDNTNGEVEPGEVTVSGANSYTVRSAGGGWQVKANLTGDPPADGYGNTVITYQKVTVPNRAGKYEFGISSTTVGDGHVSTVDPHSTDHAMGNDPNVDDDAIDTDPRAHSHSDDSTNVGSITITVYEHSHIFAPAETAHDHGDNGNVKIIDGHRHTADKSHSHFDDRDDDGHVDTSEDDHDTHPEGMSSHKHNDAGTAIVEHSHTKSGKPLTVDKQDHEHATDAGGETREATEHTHDAAGDASGTADAHTHDEDGITDVSGHSHMAGTKARDGDVLDHEHDAGEVIRVGTGDDDLTQHDHDGIAIGASTGTSDPEYGAPAAAMAHTHDKAPDGTVARVSSHKHDGDLLGVKMDHAHGGTDGAVIVVTDTNLTQHDHDGIAIGASTGTSDPEYGAPEDDEEHTHDRDRSVSDVAEHEHADTDSKLADHEHGTTTGTQPESVTAHRHLRDGSVYDDALPATALAAAHTHDGANVRNVDIEHDHAVGSLFPQRHAHDALTDPVNYDDLEDHASHSLNTFGRPPLSAWHHKHDTSRDNRGGLIKLNDDTDIGSAVIAHTHTSTNTGNIVMVTDHSHAAADVDLDGFFDIDIVVEQHTHAGSGANTVKTVTAHTHDANDDVTVTIAAHTHDTATNGGVKAYATAHSHDADGMVDITVKAHTHDSERTDAVTIVTEHEHDGSTVVFNVVAHTHEAGTDGALGGSVEVNDHTHGGLVYHTHDEDTSAVNPVTKHTHAGNGSVDVVYAHNHGDTPPDTGITQNEKHIHSVNDNGKYAVYVGPVPNGAGSVTISNTGTPRLMAETGDDNPYKDLYLATKGQNLGNVRLTFKAAGTMVKGAGIRISLPADADNAFPQFYPDNPSGPAGGVSLANARSRTLAKFTPFDDDPDDGIATNVVNLTTKVGLEANNEISVNIRGVVLKAHGDPPDKDPTEGVGALPFDTQSSSPFATPTEDDTMDGELTDLATSPGLRITSTHGSGKMGVESTELLGELTRAGKGGELGNLIFTFTADGGGMATGSKVEITIPSKFANAPFEPASDTDNRAGAVTLHGDADTDLTVTGHVLTAELKSELAHGGTLVFTYKGVKAPDAEGEYTFYAKASSGAHSAPKALADDQQKKFEVTGAHGSGTVSLKGRRGSVLREANEGQQLGNLTFTYTAAGRMAKGAKVQITIPDGWSPPHHDDEDGISSPGEVKLTGKADLAIGGQPSKLTATTNAALTAGDKLILSYKSVKAPATAGSYEFETSAISYAGAITIDDAGARLDSSPEVGVGQAPDGSGTLTVSRSTTPAFSKDATGAYLAKAGESLGNLTFTYTATGKMEIGSAVEITIPGTDDDWPQPTIEDDNGIADPGESLIGGAGQAGLSISGRTLIATITVALESGNTFTIAYKNLNAPTTIREYDFTAQSKSTPGGTLKNLTAGSPTVKVGQVPVGVVSISTTDADGMSTPRTDAGPGIALGDVTITYTATARISAGGKVMVTVPAGWTRPSEDVDDGVDNPGEVELTGSASLRVTGDGGALPWKLEATTSAVVESGDTLVFTYKKVTSPSTEGSYTFTTIASISAESIPVPIAAQPTPIIIRSVVDAIAIQADDNFFAGESLSGMVTLWSGTATANALGDKVIYLSTSSMTGSFSDAAGNAITMVTITDNTNGAAFTYNDTTPGMVTLKASDMMPAADDAPDMADMSTALMMEKVVTVKSGVAGLSVNPALVKAGSDITVTATGKAGGGTVQVMDSDDMPVGTTKALDPVGDADADGNQAYTRTVSLPAELADGTYTVTVSIQGLVDRMDIEVLNDQSAPTLSDESAAPSVVANGGLVLLQVSVAQNESMIEIASVTADVSMLDSTRTKPISLSVQPDEDEAGVYTRVFTISTDNTNADGEVMVSFTATDDVGNASEPATASITLKNDVTAPTLSMESAMPSPAADGTAITISVMSDESVNVTADASSIGGAADLALAEGMDADMMGTGMYSGEVTVTGAADDEQTITITITATDGSGNSSTATVSVMIDNTGPMLSMESADPAMATNGSMVTISVSTESGATVMADASAIGGDAAMALAEGMDENMAGTGMYSADVTVADDAMDGEHMVSISASDALGNAGEAVSVMVTVDNTAPTLADAAVTPDWALNGDTVSISVSTESGATVMADASAIGGDAALALAEGMDEDMMGTGMYSADVMVTDAMGGDQMVSITASDAIGNVSESVSASVSIHVVTSASFSPADVSTGDTVMVSAMGTAGLTATFNVFDAEATNIVTEGMLTESADAAGSYSGSFDVVVDAHPTGTYWVSVNVGQASMTAEGALTIDHLAQFDLMIGAGTHLIHVPLDVTHIDGVAGTIDTVGDLYDALGDAVNFIISIGADGSWNSYLGDSSAGSVADAAIGDDTGLIAVMSSAATLQLGGNALGTGGTATISLSAGNNLVGVPLDGDPSLNMISDALASPAITAVVVSNAAGNGFNIIKRAGDPGDGAIMGGVGYIVVSAAMGSVPVVGMAWDNSGMMEDASATVAMNGGTAANGNGASTAPSIGFQTPVLQVQGKLIDQAGMMSREGLNVSVKNLSSGAVLGHTTATDDYSMTFVKLDSSAAKVGDVLEIKADSPNPLLGIRPVQHVVTAEDVLDSRISLPDLVTYEIPAQTELLANYPNPFNPETWIPFRLAEDARVSLTIYGASGSLVRTIDIGFTPAAVYQGRSEAIYWDGRNDFGEQVSSGIYFYHLNAGDFSATRKMVIVK